MNELGNLGVLIGADVEQAGFNKAIAAILGVEKAADKAAAGVDSSFDRIGAAADKGAQRITDSTGRIRDGYGKFVSAARLAEEAAGNVGGRLGGLEDVAGRVSTSFNTGLISSFAKFDATIKPLDEGIGRLGESIKDIGTGLTATVTLPLVGLGGAALKIGGDFESAFNRVEAATQASGEELESLRNKAQNIALDPNLKFSSVQAAEALENLAKNGLNTAQILGGAADASTALATATGSTLATAADITTDVMNNFGKSADQAAGLVSNITGATIASKFSIDDYRLALGQAGAVAGQMGVNFEDFNTALAVTSSGFSSGSDAGTSFKTFLQRLVPSTKEAAEAMQKLGLNFFDAKGKMLPLRDIAGQLQKAFKGLSDQQKNNLGTQIFGADSIRTALLLAKDGVAGYDKMAQSIAKVNAAAQGETLNKGFVGAFEAFKSSLEGLAQKIADSGILAFATDLVKAGSSVASSLAQADPALLQLGVSVAAAAAAIGPLLVAIGALGAAAPAVIAGFTLLSGPVGIATVAIIALAAAFTGLVVASAGSNESVEQVSKRMSAQTAEVQRLQTTYGPLLDRYDQLKAKSVLTQAEQEELRSIIEKVGKQIPTTITSFDAYGKALDINSKAAREFIQRQQDIAAQANKVDLTKQREEYAKLEGQIRGVQNALAQTNEKGQVVKFIPSGDDQGGDFFPLTSREITDLQAKLDGLFAARRGVGGLIDQLKGIPPKLAEAGDGSTTASAKITAGLSPVAAVSDAASKAIEKLRLELSRLGALDNFLGNAPDESEKLERRVNTLTAGLKNLVDAGVSTSSRAFQGFAVDLANTSQALDKIRGAGQSLDLKPVAVKSLIPTTIGDTLDADVARLLGDYANKPIEIPIHTNLKLINDGQGTQEKLKKDLNDVLIKLGEGFRAADNELQVFGGSFDAAGAKAAILKESIQELLADGYSPLSTEIQQLAQQYRDASDESDRFKEINGVLQSGFEALGNSIGSALGDGSNVLSAALAGLIDVLAEYAAKKGKLLIADGIGELLYNPGHGALLIAAGTGLLIASGVAKAGANSIRSAGAAGASAGSSANSSPSVSNSTLGGKAQEIHVIAEFRLRGPDLVAVGRLQQYRSERTR